MHLSRQRPVRPVRADETRDRDRARVGEQFRNLGNPADVFCAVGGREAEVVVQAEADVVAVQAVGGKGVL